MSSPWFVYTLSAIAWILLLTPTSAYLAVQWATRRNRLLGVLTEPILEPYYELFYPSELEEAKKRGLAKYFRKSFQRRYGRKRYAWPLLLLAAISGMGLWAVAQGILEAASNSTAVDEQHRIAIFAFLGAYVWAVGDLLDRFRRRDFTVSDVYACSYRLILSVPMGLALTAVFKDAVGSPVAFLLGAFPTQTLFRIARRTAGQRLGLDESADDGPTELVRLQGIGRAVAERFQAEGITTLAQLAWTEPVGLTIRTNFDFDYVIDCQSLALLHNYLEDNVPKLIPFGFRGAMEVAELLNFPDQASRTLPDGAALETIRAAAEKIGMDPAVLTQTLLEVARDPYTVLLCRIWYPARSLQHGAPQKPRPSGQ